MVQFLRTTGLLGSNCSSATRKNIREVFYLFVLWIKYASKGKLKLKLKLNSVALVRERTIPTERSPPVGEVSANFCG
jgi:hypothetical protein